jgi:hypothetical protein
VAWTLVGPLLTKQPEVASAVEPGSGTRPNSGGMIDRHNRNRAGSHVRYSRSVVVLAVRANYCWKRVAEALDRLPILGCSWMAASMVRPGVKTVSWVDRCSYHHHIPPSTVGTLRQTANTTNQINRRNTSETPPSSTYVFRNISRICGRAINSGLPASRASEIRRPWTRNTRRR